LGCPPPLAEHEDLANGIGVTVSVWKVILVSFPKMYGAKLFNKNPKKAKDRSCFLKRLLILSTVVNHHFEQNHLGEYFLVHFFQAWWPSKSTYSAEW